MLVTFGGTAGSIFIAYSMEQVISSIKIAKIAFNSSVDDPIYILETILSLSDKSRREGILALDKELSNVTIPFLEKD